MNAEAGPLPPSGQDVGVKLDPIESAVLLAVTPFPHTLMGMAHTLKFGRRIVAKTRLTIPLVIDTLGELEDLHLVTAAQQNRQRVFGLTAEGEAVKQRLLDEASRGGRR